MNIRRYVANDMREALTSIRADLGPDAVMLSSRKLPEGVEVIAKLDPKPWVPDTSKVAPEVRRRAEAAARRPQGRS